MGTLKIFIRSILITLAFLVVILIVFCVSLFDKEVYETTSIADYGNYTGNHDNDVPREFINSFFPAEIDSSFTNVVYHYKAKKFDTYAYEVWLEFDIEDPDAFSAFIASAVNTADCVPFAYDGTYMEYPVSNLLCISTVSPNPKFTYSWSEGYPIEFAELGKVLYCEETQHIIFWALGMYDGGGTDTCELNHFFDHFEIDPAEYASHADSPYVSSSSGNP